MERAAAARLIEKHRRHWHSREPDDVVARRGMRTYLNVGLMFVGIALIDVIDSVFGDRLTPFRISFALVIFSLGAVFCFQSYRFVRARKLLSEVKAGEL